MRWALLGLIVLGGCAPSLKMQNPDTSRWKAPEMSKYPDAPAVVLAHEEEWLTVARPRSRWYTEQRLLHVVAIQSESAFNKFGKFTMRRHERSTELVGFRARNIRPDGEVVEVGRDAFISEEEHGDEDDEVYTVDALTFPRVVVGSIIEVELIHRYKGVRFEVGRFPMTRIPVQRYRLSFSGSDEVRYAMRVFNSDTKIQVDKDAGPGWRLSWALDDLPARPRGDFLPHRSSIEPWARMRVKQVVFPYHTWSFRKDRKGVNRSKAIPLYIENEEELEGFAERVDVSDCSGPRCKVGRVVNWVREHTHYVGRGGLDPLAEVLETKRASHHEKAFLTRTLLEGAGVDVGEGGPLDPLHEAGLDVDARRRLRAGEPVGGGAQQPQRDHPGLRVAQRAAAHHRQQVHPQRHLAGLGGRLGGLGGGRGGQRALGGEGERREGPR